MRVNLRVSGFERSLREIRKKMDDYKGGKVYATVGIHKDAGKHGNSDLTNAQIGAINHFGTEKIPARPFLDKGIEREKDTISKVIADELSQGKKPREVMKVVGELAVRGVIRQIDDTYTPPNAPSTIAKKGSSHPLIDTGELRRSITYKLRNRLGQKEE